ncbi:MAG: hypothetical protein RLO12_20330 [Fulvivirga sp.]
MNSFIKILLFTFLPFLMAAGCEDANTSCGEPGISGTDLTDSLVNDLKCSLKKLTDQDEVTFSIKSQDEWNEWLNCETAESAIDFTEEFIVGGRYRSYQCGYLKDFQLTDECEAVRVEVIVEARDCEAITEVYFFHSIPLNYSERKIEFTIKQIEQ